MVISFISYKGGVGKTTLSENVAVCFAHAGRSVCIVDADESGNSVSWFSKRGDHLPKIDVIHEKSDEEIVYKIQELNEKYDLVIIDSPPSQQAISDMIILMSNLVLVPILPKGEQEANTIRQLVRKIKSLEITKEKSIPYFFIMNEYDERKVLHRQFAEMIEKEYPTNVLESKLKDRVVYSEVTHSGMGVYEGDDNKAKHEITELVNEIGKLFQQQA